MRSAHSERVKLLFRESVDGVGKHPREAVVEGERVTDRQAVQRRDAEFERVRIV